MSPVTGKVFFKIYRFLAASHLAEIAQLRESSVEDLKFPNASPWNQHSDFCLLVGFMLLKLRKALRLSSNDCPSV